MIPYSCPNFGFVYTGQVVYRNWSTYYSIVRRQRTSWPFTRRVHVLVSSTFYLRCLQLWNITISARAASSEFVSSSIPSWQILTAHAQPFREARDLVFCLKVPLDSLLVWASSEGSSETARMRRLAWTFAARIGDKYQTRLARPSHMLRYKGVENLGGLRAVRNPCILVQFGAFSSRICVTCFSHF